MQHKQFSVEFKSDTDSLGEFSALVSVFGNVDRVNDRVIPGAFAKTIGEWEAKSAPLPIVWAHNIENPLMFIGSVKSMEETSEGLVVEGSLNLTSNEYARAAYDLLRNGVVQDFSFSYDGKGRTAKDGAFEVTEIDLYEVGPCLVGANPEAGLMAIKSAADVLTEPEPEPEVAPLDARQQAVEKLVVESFFDF